MPEVAVLGYEDVEGCPENGWRLRTRLRSAEKPVTRPDKQVMVCE